MKTILITGIAGLVGQNLTVRLRNLPDVKIIGIDKHKKNCEKFREIHPDVELIEADLSKKGEWEKCFKNVDAVVLNQAQIGGLYEAEFIANNVTATQHILDACKQYHVEHIVHISSSVVNSMAEDFYTRSKTEQEQLVVKSQLDTVILRPTLMFGWFDRKHLGWLARFMKRSWIFPIPGNGRYIRQPLYVGDFCNIIIACLNKKITGKTYDISGIERIYYIDLIKLLKRESSGSAHIVRIPYGLFWCLLKLYSFFNKKPPFTTKQLEALVLPEEFPIIDWPQIFRISLTSIQDALRETYNHPEYSQYQLEF